MKKKPAARKPRKLDPSQRDEKGKFVKGWQGGPGNPSARRSIEIRRAFEEAITESDLKAIAKTLVKRAIAGDTDAAKIVLDRTLGKVVQPVEATTKSAQLVLVLPDNGRGGRNIVDGRIVGD